MEDQPDCVAAVVNDKYKWTDKPKDEDFLLPPSPPVKPQRPATCDFSLLRMC